MASVDLADRRELLDRLEQYYDAVPRSGARVEDFGPLSLFIREGQGWPFSARSTLGWSGSVSAADVHRVRARQRELGIPESFEWVAETAPALRAAVEQAGLAVHEHPLMVLGPDVPAPALPEPADGVVVRTVGPDDPVLPSALAVPHLAFAESGTGGGAAGLAELGEVVRGRAGDGSVKRAVARILAGLTCVAAAVEDNTAVLGGCAEDASTSGRRIAGARPVAWWGWPRTPDASARVGPAGRAWRAGSGRRARSGPGRSGGAAPRSRAATPAPPHPSPRGCAVRQRAP
ncbi:GNAT family N-acetyltransferase [Streptomyces hirsutus]|uniref:GNAT family N-acetyltransferase n=1 Tax=Streptomyces hirsutus TaxID=35620 RepID=UPI0033E3D1F7